MEFFCHVSRSFPSRQVKPQQIGARNSSERNKSKEKYKAPYLTSSFTQAYGIKGKAKIGLIPRSGKNFNLQYLLYRCDATAWNSLFFGVCFLGVV